MNRAHVRHPAKAHLFLRAPGRSSVCHHCGQKESDHRWQCPTCGKLLVTAEPAYPRARSRSPVAMPLPAETCHDGDMVALLVCPAVRIIHHGHL